MAEVKGAHIFHIGTWNGINIDGAVLDSLVSSFNLMANAGRVPLKFGHNDEQPFTDGQPAIGWVSRVWREGEQLLADFTGLPAVVFDAIKQGLYKFVSIEMLRDVEWDGLKWPAVLDAVALLGADRPAVSVLKDLQGMIPMSRAIPSMRVGARAAFTQDFNSTYGAINKMSDDIKSAIEAALAPVAAELTKVRSDFSAAAARAAAVEDENKQLKARIEEQAARDRTTKIESNKARFKAHVDAQILGGKVTPAKRDEFATKYLKDDAAYEALDFGLVDIVFGKVEEVRNVSNKFSAGNNSQQTQDVAAELRRRVRELRATKPHMDVFTANAAVLRADPDFAAEFRAHLNVTGHERGQPIAMLGN